MTAAVIGVAECRKTRDLVNPALPLEKDVIAPHGSFDALGVLIGVR